MKKTKLAALTLAGMMAVSQATPVFAEGVNVGFTKAAPNRAYTMTVPTGNTSVATDGTFSSIGELKVVSDAAFDTGSKVEVTVSRSTVMTNTESSITSNNTITYDLYTGEAKADGNKVANGAKIEFSASQIDEKTPVKMGVAISGSNYDALEPGDYRDTINFTAEAVAVSRILTKEEVIAKVVEVKDEIKLNGNEYTLDEHLDISETLGVSEFSVDNGTYVFVLSRATAGGVVATYKVTIDADKVVRFEQYNRNGDLNFDFY